LVQAVLVEQVQLTEATLYLEQSLLQAVAMDHNLDKRVVRAVEAVDHRVLVHALEVRHHLQDKVMRAVAEMLQIMLTLVAVAVEVQVL